MGNPRPAVPLPLALAQALDELIAERPERADLHLAALDVINRAFEIAEPMSHKRRPRKRVGRPRKLDEREAAAYFATLKASLSKRNRIQITARKKGVSQSTVKAALRKAKKVGQKL